MKKIFLFILLSCCVKSFSQSYPFTTPQGATNNLWYNKGSFGVVGGMQFITNYPDTTSANAQQYIKYTPGIVIRVNDTLWVRNNLHTAWIKLGAGAGDNLTYPASVVKDGTTVLLENDEVTPSDTSGYHYIGGIKQWFGDAVVNIAVQGGWIKHVPGSNHYFETAELPDVPGGAAFEIQFRPALWPNAPANGDSVIFVDSLFDIPSIDIGRDGQDQFFGDPLYGYEYDGAGTIRVHPPFIGGERIIIRAYRNLIDTVSLVSPAAVWAHLTYTTATALLNTSDIWTPTTSNGWGQYGLDVKQLTGDGGYRVQYAATDGTEVVLGFNASNSNQDYTFYEYGVALLTGGALSRVVNGTPTSLGISLSVGNYVGIFRSGSTFTIQTSTNGVTWATVYTFGATSSATHYVNIDLYQTGKAYYPMGYNLNSMWLLFVLTIIPTILFRIKQFNDDCYKQAA